MFKLFIKIRKGGGKKLSKVKATEFGAHLFAKNVTNFFYIEVELSPKIRMGGVCRQEKN